MALIADTTFVSETEHSMNTSLTPFYFDKI